MRTCFCGEAHTRHAGLASASSGVRLGNRLRSAAFRDCGSANSAGSGSASGTRNASGSAHGGQTGSSHGVSASWSANWSESWTSWRRRTRRSGGCGSTRPSAPLPLEELPTPHPREPAWVPTSVTDRALALRPGVGPPGWGGARGFPGVAPDAAAAAAAAAASSSLPPKLVMKVIFSSRPGLGERERERDSELDSEGDLQQRVGKREASTQNPPQLHQGPSGLCDLEASQVNIHREVKSSQSKERPCLKNKLIGHGTCL